MIATSTRSSPAFPPKRAITACSAAPSGDHPRIHPAPGQRGLFARYGARRYRHARPRDAARRARYVRDKDGNAAEFAIVIADAWHRGIGSRLLAKLIDAARRARREAPLRGHPRHEPADADARHQARIQAQPARRRDADARLPSAGMMAAEARNMLRHWYENRIDSRAYLPGVKRLAWVPWPSAHSPWCPRDRCSRDRTASGSAALP